MRLRHVVWAARLGMAILFALSVLGPSPAAAQAGAIVHLEPLGNSGVHGTVTLVADGERTHVTLDVTGLTPGVGARATAHALTCEMPSASFVALPDLTADAAGRATATGTVRFHDQDLALSILADDEHVIFIHAEGEPVACGTIHTPASTPDSPGLPASGAALSPLVTISLSLCGSGGLLVGLMLRATAVCPENRRNEQNRAGARQPAGSLGWMRRRHPRTVSAHRRSQ